MWFGSWNTEKPYSSKFSGKLNFCTLKWVEMCSDEKNIGIANLKRTIIAYKFM